MSMTIKTIIERSMTNLPPNESPQARAAQLHSVWLALVEEVRAQLRRGIGVMIHRLGAFVFMNDVVNGQVRRTPAFLFSSQLLSRIDHTCAPANDPKIANRPWGGIYDAFPPLQPLSAARVGQRAGVAPTNAAQRCIDEILTAIERALADSLSVRIDFGTMARITSTPSRVSCVLGREWLQELANTRTADGKPVLQTARSVAATTIERDRGMLTSTLWTGTLRHVQ